MVLLPLLLSGGTVAGLGSYYETSDDATLTWFFAGVLALKPVPSVPLYFHGYGHLLAAAYPAMPGVPWLGLLLCGLLALATMLIFAVLDRLLRPHWRGVGLALILVLFFGLGWVEHWLWFSHARVGVLLAGAAVLYAAQRPARRSALLLGLAGVGAAWLLRPNLAVLGVGAALPAALLLAGSWRRAVPVVISVGLGLVLAGGAAAWRQTPAEARTQVNDRFFAQVLDFEQLRPQPATPVDSLATSAIPLWLLGDATVTNEALPRRAYHFDAADFWGHTVPAKLALRAGLLVRDYFPLLLALLATTVVLARRPGRQPWFWFLQLSFFGGLVLLAGLLKLPPRLALPLLDCWLITNLIFWLKPAAATAVAAARGGVPGSRRTAAETWSFSQPMPRWLLAGALLVGLAYGAKTLHRRQVLGQERGRHERALAEISTRTRTSGQVRVLSGPNDLLKSLSPFRVYTLGPGPVLLLTGWPAHDPSQPLLRQQLAGTSDQTSCLRRLAASGCRVQWLFSAETAQWLNRRFRYGPAPGPALRLLPGATLPADTTLRFYQPVFE